MQMTNIACGIINGYCMHWFASQNVFYFILDVFFTEFTYTPIFLLDYIGYEGLFSFPFILFYLKFICLKEDIFWINFDVFGKNFINLRVSG